MSNITKDVIFSKNKTAGRSTRLVRALWPGACYLAPAAWYLVPGICYQYLRLEPKSGCWEIHELITPLPTPFKF